MRENSIKFVLFLNLLIILSSCSYQRSGESLDTQQRNVSLSEGNGKGFDGSNGLGYSGAIKPTVSRVLVPTLGELSANTKITLVGTHFEKDMQVIVSGVECLVNSVASISSAQCILKEGIASVTSVYIQLNAKVKSYNEKPLVELDSDEDGIPDTIDNCPEVPNPGQEFYSYWNKADACDGDFDNDTILDGSDNCPEVPNPMQEDSDWGDFPGDACFDSDKDKDGVVNTDDNCSNLYNPDQSDFDGNFIGDACDDSDKDKDGILNIYDNCPFLFNPLQENADQSGVGDVCESVETE